MRFVPLVVLLLAGCQKAADRVVVSCAQDREFAGVAFEPFEQTEKLTVAPKYDTEANKSVGLAAELLAEKDRPRCDVHWNNEPIGTIRLARAGVYEPYASPNAEPFPAWTKQPGWQAFASRARVLIVNTRIVPVGERPRSIRDLADPKWKGKIAIAKPLFGTTATHAAALAATLGPEGMQAFFRSLKANGVQIVAGNKQVATGVSEGRFAFGLTDTDDAILELNDRKPVAVIFPDRDSTDPKLGVLYIPNTVALIRGGPNPAGGKKLIDHLLRKTTEANLALAGGYQIPLNPECDAKLHKALLAPHQVTVMPVNWEAAADMWDATQSFLRTDFWDGK
jgi:iron(III) transport system substrate-binding protein